MMSTPLSEHLKDYSKPVGLSLLELMAELNRMRLQLDRHEVIINRLYKENHGE